MCDFIIFPLELIFTHMKVVLLKSNEHFLNIDLTTCRKNPIIFHFLTGIIFQYWSPALGKSF